MKKESFCNHNQNCHWSELVSVRQPGLQGWDGALSAVVGGRFPTIELGKHTGCKEKINKLCILQVNLG